jgi:uncharacterized caspase-like protein
MIRSVVVGLNRYASSTISPLAYAVADTNAFVSGLQTRFSQSELDLCVLQDEKATKKNVTVAIADQLPRRTTKDDVVVLYFAGHGSPEADDSPDRTSRYLVVHDTEYESICATGIDLEHELIHWLRRLVPPRLVVVFIDACFSGMAGGRTFEGPRLRRMRANRMVLRARSLADIDLGEGRLIITACDDDQVAFEDSSLGHGVFTFCLLDALTSVPPDLDAVDIATLYQTVATRVRERTRGAQTPIINGRSRLARFPTLGSAGVSGPG